MIEIGTLVRYKKDGDYGVVCSFLTPEQYWWVQWSDGTSGYHLDSELEAIA